MEPVVHITVFLHVFPYLMWEHPEGGTGWWT